MNITDLIVELLEKGQKVEMPGIGTLDSVVRSAHHDPATRTYYPASRVIAYSTETSGESEIVKTLAERECVSEDVAKQMWLNYIDALTDKVKRTGHHNFGKLGTLTCDDKRTFGFKMAEGVVLDAGNKGEMPIEEVKIYNHDNEEDPFARFDEAEETPAPAEPAAEETTAPEPTAEEATDTNEEHWDESLKQLEDLEKEKPAIDPKAAARAEKERLEAEKKAEKERIKLEKKVEEQRRFDEEQLAKQRKEAERREAEEKRKAAEELRKAEKRAEEERVKAEKKAEAGRQKAEKEAEKERIKAEKKAAAMAAIVARESAKAEAAARSEAEKEAAKQAAIQAAKEAKERKEAEKEAARMEKERRKEEAIKAKEEANRAKKEAKERKQAEKEAAKQAKKNKELADKLTAQTAHESDDGKKKSKVWLIVLIVLCLLLLAGGAYYLLSGNKTAETPVAAKSTTHIDAGAVNAFTYNTDMINHSGREIEQQSDLVCRFMSDYISQYLADRNFSGARAPMMDRIRQYANERLEQMLGDRFAVQRLIPYNDYIYKYNEPFMKGSYARSCRGKVQGELMNYRALDDMLYRMADELGLQPDGNGRKTAAEVQQVKADEKKAIERRRQMAQNGDAPTYVYVEKGSKQGYDLIAGFYLNKSTAAKLTARLHEMGCDAYIIEVNDMYYVSMGSANNQTAAEALYKHVKSWYDGDVVIKKW